MSPPRFVCLLIVTVVSAITADLPAHDPTPESDTQRQLNQVFVKVIVPVTSRTPKQDGPAVESWVAERLKQQVESEFFAVTNWVPVCDALLEDDIVDNEVWDGILASNHAFCSVDGDIPEREHGRVLVSVGGWTPAGGAARIKLQDEPGSRGVCPVRLNVGNEGKRTKIEEGLPYVAVIIAPPPVERIISRSEAK